MNLNGQVRLNTTTWDSLSVSVMRPPGLTKRRNKGGCGCSILHRYLTVKCFDAWMLEALVSYRHIEFAMKPEMESFPFDGYCSHPSLYSRDLRNLSIISPTCASVLLGKICNGSFNSVRQYRRELPADYFMLMHQKTIHRTCYCATRHKFWVCL